MALSGWCSPAWWGTDEADHEHCAYPGCTCPCHETPSDQGVSD